MNILLKCVKQSGYSVRFPSGVISQPLDGGAPRMRRVSRNNWRTVAVNWTVQESGYQYLCAFYEIWCENPSQPFYANLIVDGPEYKAYRCHFEPDSFGLDSKEGTVFGVSAQFLVKPIIDRDLNQIIVDSGNNGVDLSDITNPLDHLVNVALPKALESIRV
ncbi:hypothetical protein EC844_12525 [Acinetobacter calcoaceticus]|uniref:Uncharacterized protein n=1 Tax=Acinetobacter calcoaceticus TaxID=471 RepID=A0A4R1XEK2_ACICA|nr:hypothetical protein EC844_12525 [Acinetobacter calcoaceticus]